VKRVVVIALIALILAGCIYVTPTPVTPTDTPVPWPQVGPPVGGTLMWKWPEEMWTKPAPTPTPIPGPMDLRPGQLRWNIPL
jgi:hypothetical protein